MIIDFRVRPPYKSYTGTHLYGKRDPNHDPVTLNGLMMNMPRYRSFDERSMDAFMDEMDQAGIDLGVVVGRHAPPPFNGVANSDVAEIVSQHPNRFVGFGSVDVSKPAQAVKDVQKLASDGFRGIAFDNPWAVPPRYDDDESIFPIYEACSSLGMIAMITSSIMVGPDLSFSDPIHIQHVAQKFPSLPIVIAHGAWPWTTQACAVAFQNTNVYLMPDFYFHIANTPGAEEYLKAANYYLSYRLLYASSFPVRPLDESVRNFRALGWASDEIRDRCLGGNAARLLGLKVAAK